MSASPGRAFAPSESISSRSVGWRALRYPTNQGLREPRAGGRPGTETSVRSYLEAGDVTLDGGGAPMLYRPRVRAAAPTRWGRRAPRLCNRPSPGLPRRLGLGRRARAPRRRPSPDRHECSVAKAIAGVGTSGCQKQLRGLALTSCHGADARNEPTEPSTHIATHEAFGDLGDDLFGHLKEVEDREERVNDLLDIGGQIGL
jgi:hypothetical protein